MKSIIFFLAFFFCTIASKAEVDTIDVWHVYYNKTKINEFNDYNKGKISIKAKDYKSGDKIIVRHFDDTPCGNCPIFLFLERGKQEQVIKAIGEGNPLVIDVTNLIDFHKLMNVTIYVYYSSGNSRDEAQRKLLFEIEII